MLAQVYELVSGQPMGRINFEEVRGLEGIKEAALTIVPAEGSPFKKYDPEGKGLTLRICVANGLGEWVLVMGASGLRARMLTNTGAAGPSAGWAVFL